MYNFMYHRPLDSAFDAHLIHLRYNLAFSHQACDSRLITFPLALQPRIQPSSVRFKADHLVHFFFSVYAEGDARMHAHFSNIHRVQPYKRATTSMHSAPIPGVHIYCVQNKLDLGLSRTTQPTMSRSSRSHSRSAALLYRHHIDDATCP
jgi:hypothetical protein